VDISLFGAIASQYHDLLCVHTGETMNLICDLIEEQVINHKLSVDLYTGVQNFSEVATDVPRYKALGAVCRRVFVFGLADVTPPTIPGVEFFPLKPDTGLAQERFLLVNTPGFWAALLAKEISEPEASYGIKRYDGGWFYDEQAVERISLLLSQVMGKFYQPVPERYYDQQSKHIAEINRRLLVQLEESELVSQRRSMRLTTLNQFAAILLQHQPLPCMMRDAVQILSMIFGATEAAIAYNMHGGQFMVMASGGDINNSEQVSSLGEGASGQAFRQGKLVMYPDTKQKQPIDPLTPQAVTILSAPIKGRRKIYGVVTVGDEFRNKWNREDAQTVGAIANMLAVIIEQKVQISGDVTYQLRQAKHFSQILKKLRRPMARLLELQEQLRKENEFSPTQIETLAQIETLYNGLAMTLGFPVSLNFTNDSYLPPPPKTTYKASRKTGTETQSADQVATSRLGSDPS